MNKQEKRLKNAFGGGYFMCLPMAGEGKVSTKIAKKVPQLSWLFFLFYHSGFEDADVVERPVVFVARGPLDEVGDVEAFNHFAEDGVLSIEVGRATKGAVNLLHVRGEAHGVGGDGVEPMLHFVEHVGGEYLSSHDVEL